ncbi:2-succinyl-6-hydroxy-2,4-cyclohexadiene-1-carboxylate synthase [Bacillus sp. AK128]
MEISLNGVTYSYMLKGKGPALLLLHGFTGCKENWTFLIDRFSSSYQVIALDLLGHGRTESPLLEERYSFDRVCHDIYQLLEQLSISDVHLIGYSMGGRVALAFSIMYPEKITSLLLESSSPGLLTEEERLTRIAADESLAHDIMENGIEPFVKKWENIPLFASQKKLPEETKRKIHGQRLHNVPIGLANSLKGMGTGRQLSYWDKLEMLKMPVLLVCGELDQKFCQIANQMKIRIPQAIICQISQVGHAIHVEEPDLFVKIVDEFLHSIHN